MVSLKKTDRNKLVRFRRPEFQEKLAKARRYQRSSDPIPDKLSDQVLRSLGLKSWLARVFLILLVLVAVYFLTISRVFLIQRVTLRSEGISVDEINAVIGKLAKKRIYFVPENHIILLDHKMLLSALQEDFPSIRRLTFFKRSLPNKLEIAIEFRKPSYVWQTGPNYFLLDQDGVVYQQISDYATSTFPQILISDESAEQFQAGSPLPIQKALNFIEQIRELWPKVVFQTGFDSFVLPNTLSTDIKVKTALGFMVYFDLERSVPAQLGNLSLLLNREIKPETYGGLAYIDLRLPSIAYYCYRDAPCAQQSHATSTTEIINGTH